MIGPAFATTCATPAPTRGFAERGGVAGLGAAGAGSVALRIKEPVADLRAKPRNDANGTEMSVALLRNQDRHGNLVAHLATVPAGGP